MRGRAATAKTIAPDGGQWRAIVADEPNAPIVNLVTLTTTGDFVDDGLAPIRVINRIVNVRYGASLFELVLGTVNLGVAPDGNLKAQTLIASRLRFDLQMAQLLRDTLDKQIAALTAPEGKAN
jgi:hypothetical protein